MLSDDSHVGVVCLCPGNEEQLGELGRIVRPSGIGECRASKKGGTLPSVLAPAETKPEDLVAELAASERISVKGC
jgi:hypothetical protein